MGTAKRRLLVVDDEEALLKLIRRKAEAAGLDVVEARNSVQGFNLSVSDMPDVILLDLELPTRAASRLWSG